MHFRLLLIVIFCGGCTHFVASMQCTGRDQDEYDECMQEKTASTYDRKWTTHQQQWLSQTVEPECQADDDEDDDHECGTIIADIYKETPTFIKAVCKGKPGTPECREKFVNMIIARWRQRYPHADWDQANLWCQANPAVCDLSTMAGAANFELQLLQSHNNYIFAKAKLDHDQIQAEEALDSQRRAKIIGDAFKAFGDGLQKSSQQQVHCQSSTYGPTTYTDCN